MIENFDFLARYYLLKIMFWTLERSVQQERAFKLFSQAGVFKVSQVKVKDKIFLTNSY